MRGLAALAIGLCVLSTSAARAEQLFPEHNTSHLALQAGVWDSGINGNHNKRAGAFGAEYRWGAHLWVVHPFIGLNANSRAGVFGYGGILFDVSVIDRFWFTPSFAVGGYHRGGGKDVGSVIQFRSALELSYEFGNKSRLGVRFEHISNAGIKQPNPGIENFWLVYSVPVSKLFGK
ncbi:MAG TPA: acyloxyacyl hydrolase [Alphaproteobacteria bacterium]|nr:acyloxyacyl hydrolase [Alphaproteobacteria bacterium]